MNYIDLTSNKTWTDDQINRRLTSAIRARVSVDDELKAARLGRKSSASRTTAEKAHLKFVDDHIAASLADAKLVTVDNALLRSTIAHEDAVNRIAKPALDPLAKDVDGNLLYPKVAKIDPKTMKQTKTMLDNPAVIADTEERIAAQVVIDAVDIKVAALVKTRANAAAKLAAANPVV